MHTKTKKRYNSITQSLNHLFTSRLSAFTLAETLITLGVIGVVAAVTLPTLITNVQERVRQEQVRTVKYKFTKATEKMNSLGLIGHYDSTMDFVNELKKHMSIAKVCTTTELDKCWPSREISTYTNSTKTLQQLNVKAVINGTKLNALALGTKNSASVGIVTGDGVPMILVYSPLCSGFDEAKNYTWAVENGKPVTNATTNCISAIFDINGAKGPNKVGQDVRTLNSLFGAINLGSVDGVGVDICNNMKKKYGFKYCNGSATLAEQDRWVGGIYQCDKLGLHLPSMATLANIANARYGTTQIGVRTIYIGATDGKTCEEAIVERWGDDNPYTFNVLIAESDAILCNKNMERPSDIALTELFLTYGHFFSNEEFSEDVVFSRSMLGDITFWYRGYGRNSELNQVLCVSD